MNRRIILITVTAFFLISFTTGCWNRVELNEKAIVAGAGIDKAQEKGKINLTMQVILPGEVKAPAGGGQGGGAEKAVWVVTSTGRSVFDAVRNFALRSGRKGFWAHAKVIVIGEETAKEGIDKIIDWFEREPEVRRRTWVLVSRGDAKKIIEAEPELEKIQAYEIASLVKASKATSKVPQVNLNEFLGMASSKTTCPFTTGIEEISSEDKKSKTFRLAGTAVFKNYKLKGWLDAYETRGLLWVLGKVVSGIIEVECLLDGEKPTAQEIIRTSSKVKPKIKDGDLTITVEVFEEGNIGETPIPCADLTKPENIKRIEKRVAEVIKREINMAVKKAQEFNTDIFGFGEAVHRKYPSEWKELENKWDEIFPHLEVTVKVDAKIRRTGLIFKSAMPE